MGDARDPASGEMKESERHCLEVTIQKGVMTVSDRVVVVDLASPEGLVKAFNAFLVICAEQLAVVHEWYNEPHALAAEGPRLRAAHVDDDSFLRPPAGVLWNPVPAAVAIVTRARQIGVIEPGGEWGMSRRVAIETLERWLSKQRETYTTLKNAHVRIGVEWLWSFMDQTRRKQIRDHQCALAAHMSSLDVSGRRIDEAWLIFRGAYS